MWNAIEILVAGTSRSTIRRRSAVCCGSAGMLRGGCGMSGIEPNHCLARSIMRSSSISADMESIACEGW